MANVIKQTIFLILLLAAGFYIYSQMPVKEAVRMAVTDYFDRAGITVSKMDVETVSPIGLEISHIETAPSAHFTIGMMRINMLANTYDLLDVVVPGMMDGKDATFNLKAHMGFADEKPAFICELSGQPQNIAAHFNLIAARKKTEQPKLHVLDAKMSWGQGGTLSVQNTVFTVGSPEVVPFSLRLDDIPLESVLKLAAGPQAGGTGSISGVIPMQYAGGQFRVLGVDLSTKQPGVFQLGGAVPPGAPPSQVAMASTLSNFQYSRLMLASMGNPPTLVLTIEGKNPVQPEGQDVKLQFNVGPGGLEAINRLLNAPPPPAVAPQQLVAPAAVARPSVPAVPPAPPAPPAPAAPAAPPAVAAPPAPPAPPVR